jgi:ABC-type transporter Mla maintaining outer membrane lipid asymmetry ATPase subunit MlaF
MNTPVPPSCESVVQSKNLVAYYGRHKVLEGVSLDVTIGEIMVIKGGSGAGKSTLLRCLLGLHGPNSGQIRLFGRGINRLRGHDWADIRRKMVVSFQGGLHLIR